MGVVRFGLDPELAIVSKKTGKAKSAHLFMNKKTQFRFESSYDSLIGSEVERDGPAVEIRSVVNSACRDNIIPYMAEAMRQTSLKLETWKEGRFKLSSAPMYKLDTYSLKNAPADVSEFGCNPDMDAYTLQPKSPTLGLGDIRRYTGGHIHVSRFNEAINNVQEQAAFALLFDYTVALPFVSILGERHAAGEAERRQFYGQPGSFRFDDKLGKIEFRTLSGRLMLHPTLLAWAMGMVRSFAANLGYNGKPSQLLKESLLDVVPTHEVYAAILNHDVQASLELTPRILTALPNFGDDGEKALSNPLSSGGGGTSDPNFFLKSWEVFTLGNANGIGWDDDLVWNWGLYKNYTPTHHKYWGIQVAMVGLCDDDIFPYNAVLPEVWPKKFLQANPIYTHPTNGGKSKWTTPGAAGWLQ